MKNILVVDGAANSTFGIWGISDELFEQLFPEGRDVAFATDFEKDLPGLDELYQRRIAKKEVQGIHGTLHLEMSHVDPKYFPSRKESEVRQ